MRRFDGFLQKAAMNSFKILKIKMKKSKSKIKNL
jgi:hypothetical protein